MNCTWIAPLSRQWRLVVLASAAILVFSTFSVPPASAALVDEVVGTVESTVESVTPAPSAAPSLPPVATPPVPAAPQAPVTPQAETAPPSSSPVDPGVNVPPVGAIAGAATDSVASDAGAGETTQQAAAPVRDGGSGTSVPPSPGIATSEAPAVRPSGTGSSPSSPIAPAEVAPARGWFIHVWPAIPLGSDAVREWVGRVMGHLLRPVVVASAPVLLLSPSLVRATGEPPFSGRQATANPPRPNPSDAPGLAEGGRPLLVGFAGLVLAFLAVVVLRELRSVLRTTAG